VAAAEWLWTELADIESEGLLKTRATLLLTLVALAAVSCARGDRAGDAPQKSYNVVLIVSDALRQDVLGCYGGIAKTPNIDALAASGVLFENSYSTSPWTSPSSVAMFTGNYATSYAYSLEGLTKPSRVPGDDRLVSIPRIYVPNDEPTLIEALSDAGYATAMKIENVNAQIHNALQGLDSIPESPPTRALADSVDALTRGALGASLAESEGYRASFFFLRGLLELPRAQPFFAVHWILDPHSPYHPVEKFRSRIAVDTSRLPVPPYFYWTRVTDRSKMSAAEHRFMRDLYVAEVESVDERVGFIVDALRERGHLEDTYVVFTSDHGEQFGAHGLYEHGGHGKGCHYYEGLVRVPFIIAGPGIPRGKRIGDAVSLLGLMPTLKELLGVEYPEEMQGESYCALISGTGKPRADVYFDDVQVHDQVDALVEGGYKLITRAGGGHELYAIDIDPGESIDLAAKNPTLVEAMDAKIQAMRKRNARRRKRNTAALGSDVKKLSGRERAAVIEKLRALGYVK